MVLNTPTPINHTSSNAEMSSCENVDQLVSLLIGNIKLFLEDLFFQQSKDPNFAQIIQNSIDLVKKDVSKNLHKAVINISEGLGTDSSFEKSVINDDCGDNDSWNQNQSLMMGHDNHNDIVKFNQKNIENDNNVPGDEL